MLSVSVFIFYYSLRFIEGFGFIVLILDFCLFVCVITPLAADP